MTTFKHEPFGNVSDPITTSTHKFKSGRSAIYARKFSGDKQKKIAELKAEIKAVDSKKTEPKLDKKTRRRKKNLLKGEIKSLEDSGVLPSDTTDYYNMSYEEYIKFRNKLKKSFPAGLKRKWMVDEGIMTKGDYRSEKGRKKEIKDMNGKVDPRGGGAQWKREGKARKARLGSEQELWEAKEHFARLAAGFCEVVTRYWELSPHIKNPKCYITSYARGFKKGGLGNHDYGFACDSILKCQYNGKDFTIPVLQYYNSIALLVKAGRLPRSKMGLYLNVATTMGHGVIDSAGKAVTPLRTEDYTYKPTAKDLLVHKKGKKKGLYINPARAGAKKPGDPQTFPSSTVKIYKTGLAPRPRSNANRRGLIGPGIDQAGYGNFLPGGSSSPHYDFAGYFGVWAALGGKANVPAAGRYYLDLDLNGDMRDDLYGGRRGTDMEWRIANGKFVRSIDSKKKPWGGWRTSHNIKVLQSPGFNRQSEKEELSKVADYISRTWAIFQNKSRKLKNGERVEIVPFDNFLHEVDERVPNILQVLGLEGEEYVKQLGLDK